jgi:hypothetical protein
MAAWEYCRVDWVMIGTDQLDEQEETRLVQRGASITRREADERQADVRFGNVHFFRSQEHQQVERLSETLTRLGLDGWELVSFTREVDRRTDGRMDSEAYLLKRPVQE